MSLEIVDEGVLQPEKLIKPQKDIIIFVDTEKYIFDDRFKIYMQNEPESIMATEQHLFHNGDRYDVILTIHDSILKKWPHARMFQFYRCTWLDEKDYLAIKMEDKKFQVSSLVGFKRMTKAHIFRQLLYFNQQHLPSFFHFYRSGARFILEDVNNNPILGTDFAEKIKLFKEYQFSLVIENCRQNNYFTEKLIDCLITKTIPIYYGCVNISDYFDTSGWIILETESPSELIEKSKILDENYYNLYKDTIVKNFEKALHYKEPWTNLNIMLATIPEYIGSK